jgi:hypothetical protein
MHTRDFSRSFIHFRIDLEEQAAITMSSKQPFTMNHVRIPLECVCVMNDVTYVLGASCKTERVNVTENVWRDPNADFAVISSNDDFLLLKRFARCGQEAANEVDPDRPVQFERQSGKAAEAWCMHRLDIPHVEGEELSTADAVYNAIMANRNVVSRTEYELRDGTTVVLEYPVKCINVNDREGFYQVDTGPVIFPDDMPDVSMPIERFRFAYVAHNCHDWAEFIVNVPTPVNGGVAVHHYSQSRRVETISNRMIAVK